ncbi:MAG: hypothetical protein E6Q97_24505 [Desulfurellales bacterium]|nr:MAG: hypothetical protein E6Q97_24505 [Desulfurellales bacterium]
MSVRLVEIADAVVSLLNSETFQDAAAATFTAVRVVDPYCKLTDLAQLDVRVMARKERVTLESRGGLKSVDYLIDVGVRKRIGATDDTTEHDALIALVGQIQDFFFEYGSEELVEACIEASTDETGDNQWAIAEVRNERLFISVVTLTFKGAR